MKRINVFDKDGQFNGWFDLDKATEIASFKDGSPYVYGKILLATAKNKLVVNLWSNTGTDKYQFAADEAEIAEILSRGGYDGNDAKLSEILGKYEV
jgi:hypothetical protein